MNSFGFIRRYKEEKPHKSMLDCILRVQLRFCSPSSYISQFETRKITIRVPCCCHHQRDALNEHVDRLGIRRALSFAIVVNKPLRVPKFIHRAGLVRSAAIKFVTRCF
jgi:hypothetical protein